MGARSRRQAGDTCTGLGCLEDGGDGATSTITVWTSKITTFHSNLEYVGPLLRLRDRPLDAPKSSKDPRGSQSSRTSVYFNLCGLD